MERVIMALSFPPESPSWDAPTETLRFFGTDAGTSVLCAITREALSRLAGVRLSGEQDCRWVFDAHRATIETALKARYAAGRIGPFSTILLTSKDFP